MSAFESKTTQSEVEEMETSCIFCETTGRHPLFYDRAHILSLRKIRGPEKRRRWRRRQQIRKERLREQKAMNAFFDHYNKKHGFSSQSSCNCYCCE